MSPPTTSGGRDRSRPGNPIGFRFSLGRPATMLGANAIDAVPSWSGSTIWRHVSRPLASGAKTPVPHMPAMTSRTCSMVSRSSEPSLQSMSRSAVDSREYR